DRKPKPTLRPRTLDSVITELAHYAPREYLFGRIPGNRAVFFDIGELLSGNAGAQRLEDIQWHAAGRTCSRAGAHGSARAVRNRIERIRNLRQRCRPSGPGRAVRATILRVHIVGPGIVDVASDPRVHL